MVSVILDNLTAGESAASKVESHPSLSIEDVHAAVEHAAENANERIVPVP